MRCFRHQDKEAIGTCKACGKGVCPECVVTLPLGLVCSKECETRILEIAATFKKSIADSAKTRDKIRNSRLSLIIIAIIFGIGFLVFGFTSASSSSRPGDVLVGGGFLAFGIYELYKFRRKV